MAQDQFADLFGLFLVRQMARVADCFDRCARECPPPATAAPSGRHRLVVLADDEHDLGLELRQLPAQSGQVPFAIMPIAPATWAGLPSRRA